MLPSMTVAASFIRALIALPLLLAVPAEAIDASQAENSITDGAGTDAMAMETAPPVAAPASPPLPVIDTPVRIDHIVLGIADLDRGIAEMQRRTGVRAVPGGSHPGRGTHNALMSLGPGIYLEIIAPDPAQKIEPQGFHMLASMEKLTPIGWAVATDDAPSLRGDLADLGIKLGPLRPGSRTLPGGGTLNWVSFGLPGAPELAPFFIAWGQGARHPSATAPGGCKLKALALASPDATRLANIIDRLGLNVPVTRGHHDSESVTLVCKGGLVRFP
jgi:hypothetical protein